MRGRWHQVALEQACDIEYGNRVIKKRDSGTLYPVYGGGGETFRIDHYNREDCTIVSRFGMSETCVRHVRGKFYLNDSGLSVSPKCSDSLLPKFLDYFLFASQKKIFSMGRGSAQKNLDVKSFRKLEIKYPETLDEQKSIVAILDEAFAGIGAAIANTEKNLANARELFESYANNVFTVAQDEGTVTALGPHIDLLTGFAFKSKGYTDSPESIPLIRGDNIIQDSLRWEKVKRWPESDIRPYEKYLLSENDVVLAMDRTWVKAGIKFAKIEKKDLPCLLVQRVARLRAKASLDPEFLRFLIGSKNFKDYVLSIQTGLGVPHISGQQIENFRFYLPPREQQGRIVAGLSELSSCICDLEENYARKLDALSELKQSLLRRAFSGQLTAESAVTEIAEAVA